MTTIRLATWSDRKLPSADQDVRETPDRVRRKKEPAPPGWALLTRLAAAQATRDPSGANERPLVAARTMPVVPIAVKAGGLAATARCSGAAEILAVDAPGAPAR